MGPASSREEREGRSYKNRRFSASVQRESKVPILRESRKEDRERARGREEGGRGIDEVGVATYSRALESRTSKSRAQRARLFLSLQAQNA